MTSSLAETHLEKNSGHRCASVDPSIMSPFWPAVLLAVALVAAKAVLIGFPGASAAELAAASFEDALVAAAGGLLADAALRASAGRSRLRRATGVGLVALAGAAIVGA